MPCLLLEAAARSRAAGVGQALGRARLELLRAAEPVHRVRVAAREPYGPPRIPPARDCSAGRIAGGIGAPHGAVLALPAIEARCCCLHPVHNELARFKSRVPVIIALFPSHNRHPL